MPGVWNVACGWVEVVCSFVVVAPPWPGICAVAGATAAGTTDKYKIHKPINDGFFAFTTFSSDYSLRLDAFVNQGSPLVRAFSGYGFEAAVRSPAEERELTSRLVRLPAQGRWMQRNSTLASPGLPVWRNRKRGR
jgi:hypothetical protein